MSRRPQLTPGERTLIEGLARIVTTNPFLPERVELERGLLGREYVEIGAAKAARSFGQEGGVNTARLLERGERLLPAARATLAEPGASDAERELYRGFALCVLYHRWREELRALLAELDAGRGSPLRVPGYERFRESVRQLFPASLAPEPAHVLALFFQIARAFHQVYVNLIGTSPAAIRLRAAVWQSIFTHDLLRYEAVLHGRMADLATLVTGPSGTGKELVARALACSGYLAFDERARVFAYDEEALFLPLNLSALSPQLVESELFGYRKGAFTGALADRAGWFETCDPAGAVFLDEIGEIEPAIQVKLLRVLQTRSFHRLGDTRARAFRGRLISATNRDPDEELAAGRMREDLYYRLCSDRIETPSLAEQVRGDRAELHHLLAFVAARQAGPAGPVLADEALEWIERELGLDYAWPGNFRELEQCVRSVLVRRSYRPRRLRAPGFEQELARRMLAGELTADELLRGYCTLVHARTGSLEATARKLDLDRRTVRARVDPGLRPGGQAAQALRPGDP